MGNNNATASLTEEENSKLETNGMSPLESGSIETTQDQVFLPSETKDRDEEESLFNEKIDKGIQETEPQSKEIIEDHQVKNVEEEIHHSGLVMETDEQLQKQTSVLEGVETVCEATEVEELSMIGTQSVVSKLNTTESGNEEKPCEIDENVFVSPSFYETVGPEEEMVNEFLEETVPGNEVVKLDQDTGLDQRAGFPEIEPLKILNPDHCVIVDDDEVANEEKADQVISKPSFQESNVIQKTGLGVLKKGTDMETGRESSLKRMSRCRSLPVSHKSRVMGDSLVQQLVSEVPFPSRNKMGLEEADTSETLLVSCVRSNQVQETNKEPTLMMRSPSLGSDLKKEEKSNESTEKTPLLCQEKTETYEATIDVEEKTVMVERSEFEKPRGIELSRGSSIKPSGRSEAYDSFKENKGLGDNLLDKEATLGSMKGRVRKRSKSSIFGTCLCCANALN